MTVEEWRPVTIEPFRTAYVVSNLGRICRLKITFGEMYEAVARSMRSEFPEDAPGHVLAPAVSKFGYRVVSLSANGAKRTFLIYRLVARAFHGEKPAPGYVVAHCDGVSTNDRADNLQWKTHAENMQDMVDHGRSQRGTKAHGSKLCEDEVLAIRDMQGAVGCRALGRQLDVAHTTILRIWTRERWGWL